MKSSLAEPLSSSVGASATRNTKFDSIELEILWKRLISVVDEASAAFVRTCFSTLVRDGNDFAIVLTDAQGRSLAQSTMSLPGFIGCLPATVGHFLQKFPAETIEAGRCLHHQRSVEGIRSRSRRDHGDADFQQRQASRIRGSGFPSA